MKEDTSNLNKEAEGSSEMLALIYQTSLCHIPDHNLDNSDILPQMYAHIQKTSYKIRGYCLKSHQIWFMISMTTEYLNLLYESGRPLGDQSNKEAI